MILNFQTGRFDDLPPTAVRTVQDLAGLWAAAPDADDHRVVYRTYGCSGEDTDSPELCYATTVIEPGDVHGEPFMTRGHFHVKPERGEWMMTLKGTGALILRDRDGGGRNEAMPVGSVHMISGTDAHRVQNLGAEPLVFVVVWLSDCGHDYAAAALSQPIAAAQNHFDRT